MKIIINCCYTQLLYVMCQGEVFSLACGKMTILKGPCHKYEGMAGYIETEVEFDGIDLERFSKLWNSFYSLSEKRKLDLYGLAKGLGDCK